MDSERQKGGVLIPDNLEELLSKAQMKALSGLKYSGWELQFLRRPLFQDAVSVLSHPDTDLLGRLEDDGTLNTQSDIEFRK